MGLLDAGWLRAVLGEVALWSGVILVLAGVLSLYMARKRSEFASLLAETPRSDVTEVRSPGVVRVRGSVVSATGADPFTSPVGGDPASVLSGWEIEEMYDTPKTRSWESAAWGVRSVPFYVADSTGRLLVDVGERTVGNDTAETFTPERLLVSEGVSFEDLQVAFESFDVPVETEYDESPPRRIGEFLEATDGVSVTPMATDLVVDASKRRYRESTLRPGDEVSVVGYASPAGEGDTSTSAADEYVVSAAPESTLYLSTVPLDDRPDGRGSLLFGLLAGALGVGLLYVAFLL
jgi:hypothetical protein